MGELLDRLCVAVERWDARSGVPAGEETGAWYVLGQVLERPAWRRLVDVELQEIPTVAGMRRCLAALRARGGMGEEELIPELVRAVNANLEHLSEDHAQVVRRRRRWLTDMLQHPGADPAQAQQTRALLATEVVWEEMRRFRVYLTVWREETADLV
jgi:hypothetical protein